MITTDIYDFNAVRNHIIFKLIPFQSNMEKLKTLPHRSFIDLVLCYQILETDSDDSSQKYTTPVTWDLLSAWKITEEELYVAASRNTPASLPARLHDMDSLILKLSQSMDTEENKLPLPSPHQPMYVLTNQYGFLGAACIAYSNLLERLCTHFNSSYYILPCSIHETILIPCSDDSHLNELSEMVRDINQTVLDKKDILSDHAYFYDRRFGLCRA